MQGNVWEWTAGCYNKKNQVSPQLFGCKYYASRGGSWRYLAKGARFSRRHFSVPMFKGDAWGFRVVRELVEKR